MQCKNEVVGLLSASTFQSHNFLLNFHKSLKEIFTYNKCHSRKHPDLSTITGSTFPSFYPTTLLHDRKGDPSAPFPIFCVHISSPIQNNAFHYQEQLKKMLKLTWEKLNLMM